MTRTAFGPERFFFYNLFESDETGAPLAVRKRAAGTIDAYAAAVGRWLVTRDGFDFLVFYLSDYDYASHSLGPEGAAAKLGDADRAVGALLEAAGGPDEFLERYDVILCSDHGQTEVHSAAPLEDAYADLRLFRGRELRADVAVCASNRAGQVYRLPAAATSPRALAERLDGHAAVDVASSSRTARPSPRDGEELRFDPTVRLRRPARRSTTRRARARVGRARATRTPATCSSRPAEGCEFTDLGGRHHAGGGSHGSLCAGDSEVPMLAVGIETPPGEHHRDRPGRRSPGSRSPPVSSDELAAARRRMVGRASFAAATSADERVLAAMERVPRELFVPEQ